MGFLTRTVLVGGLAVMLIPADPAEVARSGKARELTLIGTLGFLKTAYDDVAGFCARNATACETGGQLVDTFEAKARTGAKWAYGFFAPTPDPAAKAPAQAVDITATGSLGAPAHPVPRPKPARPAEARAS